jgi:hypothetical protein
MVDLVKQLRETKDTHPDSLRVMVLWGADEIERLRAIKAELVAALETILNAPQGPNLAGSIQAMRDKARSALAKAKEQK